MTLPQVFPIYNNSGLTGQYGCVPSFNALLRLPPGRNGYLSALHHANRGFTEQTLKVLTIIHNFDLKRDDGTTAAQRLFSKSFTDLFESINHNIAELPRPRQSQKTQKSKTLTVHSVPS